VRDAVCAWFGVPYCEQLSRKADTVKAALADLTKEMAPWYPFNTAPRWLRDAQERKDKVRGCMHAGAWSIAGACMPVVRGLFACRGHSLHAWVMARHLRGESAGKCMQPPPPPPTASQRERLTRTPTPAPPQCAVPLPSIVRSPSIEGYRNKAEFSIGPDQEERPSVGFLLGSFKVGRRRGAEPQHPVPTPAARHGWLGGGGSAPAALSCGGFGSVLDMSAFSTQQRRRLPTAPSQFPPPHQPPGRRFRGRGPLALPPHVPRQHRLRRADSAVDPRAQQAAGV
jgi:hypothetical protein